jgi:DNA (cytosine-5)-methyltransferase 1
VDLFAGAGGLTLGVAQALHAKGIALDIRLAVDFEPTAMDVYRRNFPSTRHLYTCDVRALFDGDNDDPLTVAEARLRRELGDVDVLVGGPPCQGHSNLNNRTRRIDSKNAHYLVMARAAKVLRPRLIVIENVPAVLNDRHGREGVVTQTRRLLSRLGYSVADRVIELSRLGVAQQRRRHVLIATRNRAIEAERIWDEMRYEASAPSLRWAIGDLVDISSLDPLDIAPVPSAINLARMNHLLENDLFDLPNELRPTCQQGTHKYKSMYGRLTWSAPAQTITSGYGSIGQGRYMHPDLPRALTPHEAARIQGFPDYFDFRSCPSRSALATMIGNAVPPQLGSAVVEASLLSGLFSKMESTRGTVAFG